MIFDATISPAMVETGSAGPDRIEQVFGLALMLPVSQVGALPLPIGTIKVAYTKEETKALIEKLQQALDDTPDPEPEKKSDIILAQSLQGVEETAKLNQQMKKGQ